MADTDTAALDDLLATPAPMGDDEEEYEEVDPDEPVEDDEFTMHATEALGGDCTPEQIDALRMAIQSLISGA
jgi:hypothetical protein